MHAFLGWVGAAFYFCFSLIFNKIHVKSKRKAIIQNLAKGTQPPPPSPSKQSAGPWSLTILGGSALDPHLRRPCHRPPPSFFLIQGFGRREGTPNRSQMCCASPRLPPPSTALAPLGLPKTRSASERRIRSRPDSEQNKSDPWHRAARREGPRKPLQACSSVCKRDKVYFPFSFLLSLLFLFLFFSCK